MSQIINSDGLVLYDGPLHGFPLSDWVVSSTLPADDTARVKAAAEGHHCLSDLPQGEKVPASWTCPRCDIVWVLKKPS